MMSFLSQIVDLVNKTNISYDDISFLIEEYSYLESELVKLPESVRELKQHLESEYEQKKMFLLKDIFLKYVLIQDDLENISSNVTDENQQKAINSLIKKNVNLFISMGIIEIPVKIGDAFNSEFHKPLSVEKSEKELNEPIIIDILQKGYFFQSNKIVIRPALVKVEK